MNDSLLAAGVFRLATALGRLSRKSTMGALALVVFVLGGLVESAFAQSNVDGAIAGTTGGAGTVVIENTGTTIKRTVKVGGDGAFRVAGLQPGAYTVTYTDAAGASTVLPASVTINSTYPISFTEAKEGTVKLGTFNVTDSAIRPIDFARPEIGGIQISAEELSLLPVARNLTAIQLMAPGTVAGDQSFGDLAAVGGASVAENVYFVNGFNISNFRNGLSPSEVPFELYDNFDVMNGTISAKYGRFAGGVTSATAKSGSNQFHVDASTYWRADAARSLSKNISYTDINGDFQWWSFNKNSYYDSRISNLAVSGPLWKNKVFFYGLYNDRLIKSSGGGTTSFADSRTDSPFYAMNLDAYPFETQHLQWTYFRNKSKTTTKNYLWNSDTGVFASGDPQSTTWSNSGGSNSIVTYRGSFFGEKLHATLMGARGMQNRESSSDKIVQPYIYDARYDSPTYNTIVSGASGLFDSPSYDVRKAYRAELSYDFSLLGDHQLTIGYDSENNLSVNNRAYAGGVYYRLYKYASARGVNGSTVAAKTPYARKIIYTNGGSFKVNTDDEFVEDSWKLMRDRLTLRLGLRNESFENLNGQGATFIKISSQLAPRVSATYDLFGDKKTKLMASYNRYYLPVASNTNMRLSGGELYTTEYYYVNSVGANFVPVLGPKIGNTQVTSDGSVPDWRTIVAENIKPMYEDEFMLGLERELGKRMKLTISAKYRNLATAMDDMIVDHALAKWALRNGYSQSAVDNNIIGAAHYVLGNPGTEMHTYWDVNGDGTLENITLTPEDLGYPKAARKYYEVVVALDRVWDGKWSAGVSYTWSHGYGNEEGWVLSDIGQADAGITEMFDSPAQLMNGYGNLANDRRHNFKAHGSYKLTREFVLGVNASLVSGRYMDKLGYYDDPVFADAFGSGYTYGGVYHLVPRGSLGTLPWVFNLNTSIVYQPKWVPAFMKDKLSFKATVYNILDRRTTTWSSPYAELDTNHTADPTYGLPAQRQAPRYVELSCEFHY